MRLDKIVSLKLYKQSCGILKRYLIDLFQDLKKKI